MLTTSRAKFFCVAVAAALFALPRARAADFSSSLKLDTILAFEAQEPVYGSLYNPGNQVYKISRDTTLLDVRPNAKFTLFDKYDLVLRPRLQLFDQSSPNLTPTGKTRTDGVDFFMNEGYVLLRPLETVQLAAGRENFQWGPAESLSPSNIFVERLLVDIEPFYEVLGTYEARANVNFGGNVSWISIAELNAARDESYAIDRPAEQSEHRLGTKIEYSWDHAAKIIGLFGGGRNREEFYPAVGGYGSYVLNDAFQFYFDAVWQELPNTLYPISGQEIEPGDRRKFLTLAVAGTRYTFSDGTEARIEYIENDAGLDSSQQGQLKEGLLALPTRSQFLQAATSSPIPLPGQRYAYLSLRSSSQNVIWHFLRQPIASLHSLISVTDGSTLTFGSLESGFSDNVTGYLFGGVSAGATNSELRHTGGYLAGIGARLSY